MITLIFILLFIIPISKCDKQLLLYDCLDCVKDMDSTLQSKRWNIYCGVKFNQTEEYLIEETIVSLNQQLESIRNLRYPLFMKHLIELRKGDCYTLGEYTDYTKDHIEFLQTKGNLKNCESSCNMGCLTTVNKAFESRSKYLLKAIQHEATVSEIVKEDLKKEDFMDEYNTFKNQQEKLEAANKVIRLLQTIQNYRLLELEFMEKFETNHLQI